MSIPQPRNQKELQSFLGLIIFYYKFIVNFAEICQPLYELKKAKNFEWADKSTNAFMELKHLISTSPILKPFLSLIHI